MTDTIEERIRAHVSLASGKDAVVRKVSLLSGGACQENYRVDLTVGGEDMTLALRSDAKTRLPGSIDRAREFAVIERATAAGVKTPHVRWLGEGIVRDGGFAYFMEWVTGEAIGRKVTSAKDLAAARAKLPAELGRELAKIHGVRPAPSPDVNGSAAASLPSFDPARASLAHMRSSIDAIRAPRPAMELIHRYLTEHAPPAGDVVLVHGDFRTGNFMVNADGLVAILDWEFSHWGSRYMDLAWICLRDWRFGQLDLPVGGFGARAPFYEAYERESGISLDPALLFYWEIIGNLNWAIGSVYQGERYVYGGEDDLELVAIGRRAAEMELEAIRLIEKGKI